MKFSATTSQFKGICAKHPTEIVNKHSNYALRGYYKVIEAMLTDSAVY